MYFGLLCLFFVPCILFGMHAGCVSIVKGNAKVQKMTIVHKKSITVQGCNYKKKLTIMVQVLEWIITLIRKSQQSSLKRTICDIRSCYLYFIWTN